MGLEDTLHSEWSFVSAVLLGQEGEGQLQATLSFPNILSYWEKSGAALSLGCKLIPLPVCSMEILHTPYWLCSGGSQLCSPTSWLEHHCATQLPEVVVSPSGARKQSLQQVGL